jgi:alkyl sulfatase BDS1-like metallo-beta-lactamase superfamily hydrolase
VQNGSAHDASHGERLYHGRRHLRLQVSLARLKRKPTKKPSKIKKAEKGRMPSCLSDARFYRTLCLIGSATLLLAGLLPAGAAEPDPADRQDFEFASRGFIADSADRLIRDEAGKVIRNLDGTAFANGPPSRYINPSLQRHAQVLNRTGLFKVADGMWQVRGFDITNLTIVSGKKGWIIIDPLTSAEEARAAMKLATEHLGSRPISAVIYSHSHVDHFGGVKGVVSQADVDAGKTQIIAPANFMPAVMREWIIAGNAMLRRGSYQGGTNLPLGERSVVSFGIGQTDGLVDGSGHWSLIRPTTTIEHPIEERTVDGVRIVFQLALNTEAPSEMNMYFPDLRVLDLAETGNATLHNVLTPRGAEVRDAKVWADALTDALRRFGPKSDAVIVSHGWPRFGNAAVTDYMAKHRDAYKFMHDQTVRLMNEGLVGSEIANRLKLPDALAKEWYNRGYYGSLSFNVRAIYQRYMGWYDGNPAHLEPIGPVDEARHYIAAIGGRDKVFALATKAHEAGDDIWAVQLLNHLVMNDAKDQSARNALANIYDRLAYAQENAVWRNMYLSAASELRAGLNRISSPGSASAAEFMEQMPTDNILDLFAVRLDPAKVGTASAVIDFTFPERAETYRITIRNCVMTYEASPAAGGSDLAVTLPRASFMKFMGSGQLDAGAKVTGSVDALSAFQGWFERPSPVFPLVWREGPSGQ